MTKFLYTLSCVLLACVAAVLPRTLLAEDTAATLGARVMAATEVLTDMQRIPEQAIPPSLLDRAYAVAVIPNVIKGGFIVGGSFGKGVLLVRQADGGWSNPSFVRLANVGIGWQAGAQGADLILVFKSPQGVDNIARGKFTLGGSASASAGPVGRTATALTDGEFKSEIYSYARSRGLFAGVSVDGGAITIDRVANILWYGNATDGTATRIFTDASLAAPAAGQPLKDLLTKMAPDLRWQGIGGQAQASGSAPVAPAAVPKSKTYAVEDGVKPAPETVF